MSKNIISTQIKKEIELANKDIDNCTITPAEKKNLQIQIIFFH